jgi:dimethylglycine catabolism B
MTRKLPLFDRERDKLELCVYCPKLCRAACPVSNAEPREGLIPWGKMSTTYFAARGDIPITDTTVEAAYACTGCHGCTERCDHHNPVAETLGHAREAFFAEGVAPAAAKRVARGFGRHAERAKKAADTLAGRSSPFTSPSGAPLLVGCAYTRALPEVADDIVKVAAFVAGGPVRLIRACCGLPLRHAGDRPAFERAARALLDEVGEAETLWVADPGCAAALRNDFAAVGLPLHAKIETLVEGARARLGDLQPVACAEGETPERLRYHESCQLGRGLGLTAEPRALLTRISGRPPEELTEHARFGGCSGAGALLGATMPDVSRAIAKARRDEHETAGGGTLVTGCAKSHLSLRAAGAKVEDLHTWLSRGLPQ